jgi:2-polyprenyl-3-methyl-5-hydroxy-6-metoxy-1,4-benzoquinol methylase
MEKNIYTNLYNDQKNLGDLKKNIRIQKMASILNGFDFQDKNILDIGCYDGTFLSLVKNRQNNFFGIEASDWAVQKSRKKGLQVEHHFFDDKAKFPYTDNFFDIIVAGEIIEHVYDTDFFLTEIRRVLKPSGKLLISTPNIASLGRRLLLLFGKNPLIENSPNEADSSGHIRYFTSKTLRQLLKKHKFKIVSSQSDCVNFSNNGKSRFVLLAKIFPKFGASIIFLAEK